MYLDAPAIRRTLLCLILTAIAAPRSAAADPAATTSTGAATASTASPATASPATADDLTAKRTKLADEIAQLNKNKQATAVAADGKPSGTAATAVDPLDEQIDLLEALDLVYVQLQAGAERKDELSHVRERLQTQLDNLHKVGPPEPKPYTFLLLEGIRDDLATQGERETAFEADLSAAQQLLQQARENLDRCQSDGRAAQDRLTNNRESDQQAALAQAARLADLNTTIAQETVNLRQVELENKKAQCDLGTLYHQLLDEKEKLIAPETRFGDSDRQALLDNLAHKQQDVERQLKEAEDRLAHNQSQQTIDLARLDKEHADPAIVAAANVAYRRGRALACEEITFLRERISELEERKYFVNCRYGLAQKTTTPADLTQWHDRLTSVLAQLRITEQSLLRRIDEVRIDQASLYERAVDADKQSALRPWLDLQSQQLAHLAETCGVSLLQVRSTGRSLWRLNVQLEGLLHDRARANPWTTAANLFSYCWNETLVTVDTPKGPKDISAGKIIWCMLYLAIGLVLARLAARELARHVYPRLGLNPGAIVALQSISFYVLCVLFSFCALELSSLPFATFTFLGGALAIGIGFGSQNVCNNFISGLILLAEQPIRVGDQVEIEGIRGTIERIGARSTRMRTIANHEIMVPNSQLLQDKVTNMTLSDNMVRTSIQVTLSPGPAIEDVMRKLLAAANNHPKVLTKPESVVLFQGFSSEELTFELHFWIRMGSLIEARVIESEVREAICQALSGTNAAAVQPAAPVYAPAKDNSLPAPGMVAAAVALAVTQQTESAKSRLSTTHAPEPPARRKAG